MHLTPLGKLSVPLNTHLFKCCCMSLQGLTEASAASVLKVLGKHPRLQHLALSNNAIADAGGLAGAPPPAWIMPCVVQVLRAHVTQPTTYHSRARQGKSAPQASAKHGASILL